MTNTPKDCSNMTIKPIKECSPNQWILGEKDCPHWNKICFHGEGVFDDKGEYIGSKDGQWGYCDLLDKKFLYYLGTEAPCEKTKQTTLM